MGEIQISRLSSNSLLELWREVPSILSRYGEQLPPSVSSCRACRSAALLQQDVSNDGMVWEHHNTSLSLAVEPTFPFPEQGQSKVSFCETIHARHHSIVLGDHPQCKFLAMELGWEFIDTTEALKNHSHVRHRGRPIRKRTYWERKEKLVKIGGLSESQIRVAVMGENV